jgi:hypothetical protein
VVCAKNFLVYVILVVGLFSMMVYVVDAGWLSQCSCYSLCKKKAVNNCQVLIELKDVKEFVDSIKDDKNCYNLEGTH